MASQPPYDPNQVNPDYNAADEVDSPSRPWGKWEQSKYGPRRIVASIRLNRAFHLVDKNVITPLKSSNIPFAPGCADSGTSEFLMWQWFVFDPVDPATIIEQTQGSEWEINTWIFPA